MRSGIHPGPHQERRDMKKRIVGSKGLRRVEMRISTLDELRQHFGSKQITAVLIGYLSENPRLPGGWVNYYTGN